jgi:hypothetical protein
MKTPTRPTRLPAHVSDTLPSWPCPCSHWSATRPRNQHTAFRAKTHQHAQRKLARLAAPCCMSQTDGLRRSDRWHRSDQWTALVRPVATTAAQQTFQKASVTSLGPKTKPPTKHNLHGRKTYTKPNKTTPNGPRTDQQHQDPKTHESSRSPKANPTNDSHRSDRSRAPVRPV